MMFNPDTAPGAGKYFFNSFEEAGRNLDQNQRGSSTECTGDSACVRGSGSGTEQRLGYSERRLFNHPF
jgi:hypothetical protein